MSIEQKGVNRMAKENVQIYALKIAEVERKISARSLQVANELEDSRRSDLVREIDNFRAMLALFRAIKSFIEKVDDYETEILVFE